MTAAVVGAARRTPAVRTFLIADIRGYTRFTALHGDEAASRLARRFAEIAGEGVGAWGGELVELRGDEALAVFDSARQALRCAAELQAAFAAETRIDPSLPLGVGIGLDAGEAVPVDDGYRGAALNLAARLCSAAGPGETLASANIVHLAGPVPGLVIDELHPRTVKGIEQPIDAAHVRDGAPVAQESAAAASSGPRTSALPTLPAELDAVVPLIGRAEELRWLRWHWRRARHGHGRAVIVSGPPGIGKTRLAAELASTAHANGAFVRYLPSGQGLDGGSTAAADDPPTPTLVVVDDLDAAAVPVQRAIVELAGRIAATPTLLLVVHREEAAAALLAVTEPLATAERRLALGPLGPAEVRAIAALYAGAGAEEAPIRQLMDDSGGVPAAAHRAAASWARSVTTGRLAGAAERTEAGRRDLRTAQDDLIGDVASLERISERTRRYDPDGAGSTAVGGVTVCPYKGLATFDAVDAEYYFGRDRLVAELVAKLVGNPFLGFVGASGSGKSSAVRAGLLPALAGGVLPGSDRWVQVLMRPGDHPLAELGRALARALPDVPTDGRDPSDPLGDALDRLDPDQGLILAVDQFEEVFSATRDENERSAFIDLLTKDRRGLRIVVTIRADHYGHCADYPALARIISQTHVLVGPLTPAELESVIEAPAERVGLRVEPELVRTLVADAGGEPAVLPLLSTALLELWQARRDGWLTLEAYRAGGGLHGAVARLAESAYAELDAGQAAIARSMFLRLAGPGEGEGVLRRRAAVAELGADDDLAVVRVLDILTAARLLTTGDGFVEVAHEALLREWPRFRTWLEEDAEGHRVRLHLIGAARDWEQRGREPADLYRGARLSAALDWATEHGVELNASEREFLEASRTAAQREVEKERRTNRRLRGLLVGAAGLLVVAVVAGAVAVTQADAARQQAAIAEEQRSAAEQARAQAEAAARAARSSELAASAVSVLEEDPSLAKLLAVAAADVDPSGSDIETVLHRTYAADSVLTRWTVPDETFAEAGHPIVDLDPDGRRMVAAWGPSDGWLDTLAFVDLDTGARLWSFKPETPGTAIGSPVFSADGGRVYVGVFWAPEDDEKGAPPPSDTLGVYVLDTQTGRLVDRIDTGWCGADTWVRGGDILLIRTVPDDPALTTDCHSTELPDLDWSAALEAVDLATGTRTLVSTDPWDEIAISGDGRIVSFMEGDGADVTIIVRELDTGLDLLRSDPREMGERGQLNSFVRALNEDGTLLLEGDRPPFVIDVATGDVLAELDAGEGEHFGSSFAPHGSVVYLSGRNAALTAWDATSGDRLFATPAVGSGTPHANADGRVLVEDWTNRSVTLVDTNPRASGGSLATCHAQLTPAGQLEIVGATGVFTVQCADGARPLYVVDMDGLSVRRTIADGDGQDIAMSPDATRVASLISPGEYIAEGIRVHDALTGAVLVELDGTCVWDNGNGIRDPVGCSRFPEPPFPFWPETMSYSPDGRFLGAIEGEVAGYATGPVAWDAATGELLFAVDDPGSGLVFTPDSREMLISTHGCELVAISTRLWAYDRRVDLPASMAGCESMDLVGFAPDGDLIAVSGSGGSGGGWLHRINVGTFAVERTWRAHEGAPKSGRLSPDGSLVVTGDADGVVRVWDVETGTMLHQFGVDGQAQGVAFVGDDRVAVAPSGGGLFLFDLDRARLLETVRASIKRGFTPEECERFGFGDVCPTLEALRGSGS